jgi:hypothetical protein
MQRQNLLSPAAAIMRKQKRAASNAKNKRSSKFSQQRMARASGRT